MTIDMVMPTSTVVAQEVPLIVDKSRIEKLELESSLSFSQKNNNFLLKLKYRQNLVS